MNLGSIALHLQVVGQNLMLLHADRVACKKTSLSHLRTRKHASGTNRNGLIISSFEIGLEPMAERARSTALNVGILAQH